MVPSPPSDKETVGINAGFTGRSGRPRWRLASFSKIASDRWRWRGHPSLHSLLALAFFPSGSLPCCSSGTIQPHAIALPPVVAVLLSHSSRSKTQNRVSTRTVGFNLLRVHLLSCCGRSFIPREVSLVRNHRSWHSRFQDFFSCDLGAEEDED